MNCPQCPYSLLCWAGQLFNTHVTSGCSVCGRLQVCERILAQGVRALERASPSDPNTVFTGPASLFQKGEKPFREVHFVFECCERTHAGVIEKPRKKGLDVNPGSFGREYVEDPGPPQHSEWSDVIRRTMPGESNARSLEIKKCVVCARFIGYKRLPTSVRMLDQEPAYVCGSIHAEKGSTK